MSIKSVLTFCIILLASTVDAKEAHELLQGEWFGYHSVGSRIYRHHITVQKPKKKGDKYVAKAVGMIWWGMPYDEVKRPIKSRIKQIIKKKKYNSKIKMWLQKSEFVLEGDQITMRGLSVKPVLQSKNDYKPDKFTGKFLEGGVFSGEVSIEGRDYNETFQLSKIENFETPIELSLSKSTVHKLDCLTNDNYHYSLYIPEKYDHKKAAPVLINFSPGGNAQPFSKSAADKLGWIMVGLQESKNGPLWLPSNNLATVLFDIRRRLNLDMERVYFSGFSGGARVASFMANAFPDNCPGVVCVGAGYLQGYKDLVSDQSVFFIVGKTDMNHGEVTGLYPKQKKKRKAELIIHPGGHTWGRPDDHEKAVLWLNENTK